jgi:hypothetical protein
MIRAGITVMIGARMKISLSAWEDQLALKISFSPSASGCGQPPGPASWVGAHGCGQGFALVESDISKPVSSAKTRIADCLLCVNQVP